jgi:hypothetical protein
MNCNRETAQQVLDENEQHSLGWVSTSQALGAHGAGPRAKPTQEISAARLLQGNRRGAAQLEPDEQQTESELELKQEHSALIDQIARSLLT